jgi:hypothetical protein
MTGVMADRMPPVCKTNNVKGLPSTSKFDAIPGSNDQSDIEFDNNLEEAADYVVYFINESTLHQSPLIEVKVDDKFILNDIVDSGSEVNLISQYIYEKLKQAGITLPVLPVENGVLVTAFGKRSNRIRVQVFIEFTVGVDRFESVFMVSSQLRNDAIIGCQFLKEYGICIDFSKGSSSYIRDSVLKEHEFTTMTKLQSVTSNDRGEVREIILPNTHSTAQQPHSFFANCVDPFPTRAVNSCSNPTQMQIRVAGQKYELNSDDGSPSFFVSLGRTMESFKGENFLKHGIAGDHYLRSEEVPDTEFSDVFYYQSRGSDNRTAVGHRNLELI